MVLALSEENKMLKDDIKKVLAKEVDKWSKKTYDELLSIAEPIAYEFLHENDSNVTFEVEVDILEKKEEYVHVIVSTSDGTKFRSFKPLSDSFLVYKDSRVDKTEY